jgi:hypothetical protein
MPGTGNGVEGRALTWQPATAAVGCPKAAFPDVRQRMAMPMTPDASAASYRRRDAVIESLATSPAAEPAMPQSLLEAPKDRWLVSGVNVDHAVGQDPGLGKGRARAGPKRS